MSTPDEAQGLLVAMGFNPERVATALRECGGDAENAANLLLSGNDGVTTTSSAMSDGGAFSGTSVTTATATTSPANVSMVVCPLNQYSIDNGKSACTCIALSAAQEFLQHSDQSAAPPPSKSPTTETFQMNAEFLQNIILEGVQKYNQMSATANLSTEHLSPEDVLQTGIFNSLELDQRGGIVQGMLGNGPLGLRALLSARQTSPYWTCALITKPPETVVCCIPPSNYDGTEAAPFLLIDSHPRQVQFGAEGSYIRMHPSMDSLVQSLETLFPPTNLGPDIPEMMAAMYNQFDLYCLRLRKSSNAQS